MRFKTKDLLVTVLPKAEITDNELAKVCLLRTIICRNPTLRCLGSLQCDLRITRCGHCSVFGTVDCGATCGRDRSACDPTIFCQGTGYCPGGSRDPYIIEHLEDLVALKAELQATLKSLDAIQKEGLPSALGSKAEIESLERGLTEALDQVRAAKKTL